MNYTVKIPCDWGDEVVSALDERHELAGILPLGDMDSLADAVMTITVVSGELLSWSKRDGSAYEDLPPYHTPHSAARWRERLAVAIADLQAVQAFIMTFDADQPPREEPA